MLNFTQQNWCPDVTPMSHWCQREGHPTKIALMHQKNTTPHSEGVCDMKGLDLSESLLVF